MPTQAKTPLQILETDQNITNNAGNTPLTSNPSAVSPALKSPAAQAYIQSQVNPNQSKIDEIQNQLADKKAQLGALQANDFTDTNQLQQNAQGKYVPSNYEAAKADYSKAYESYIQALNPSAEVTNAQNTYNDYLANQGKSIAGLEGKDAGVPISLVRGQQERLLKQTQPEAQRLQNQIGIAQTNQTNKANAGLANVSLKEKLLGLEQSPAQQAKVALDTAKTNADIELSKAQSANISKKFEEDKREFGLDYALKQQQLALDKYKIDQDNATKLKTDNNTATAVEEQKQQFASQSIGIVNSLLSEGTSQITGFLQNPLNMLKLSNAKQINEFKTLKAQLALGARSLLKGSGAISDYESKTLDKSTSILDRNLSNKDFVDALKTIRGVLKTNSGQPTEVSVTNPKTKETIDADLSGEEIYNLVSEGNVVKYK